jgi:hypothetical protein
MTQPSAGPAPVFAPTGRPVARFVAGLAALSAVFALLWWTGLFSARLGVSTPTGSFQRDTDTGQAQVEIHNRAPLAATVRRVEQVGPWVHITAWEPAGELRLRGGATTTITVHYTVDCTGYDRATRTPAGTTGPDLGLRLRVHGAVGGERWLHTTAIGLSGACGQPIDTPGGP